MNTNKQPKSKTQYTDNTPPIYKLLNALNRHDSDYTYTDIRLCDDKVNTYVLTTACGNHHLYHYMPSTNEEKGVITDEYDNDYIHTSDVRLVKIRRDIEEYDLPKEVHVDNLPLESNSIPKTSYKLSLISTDTPSTH